MNSSNSEMRLVCTAITAAGKPCTYPALAGSNPPLCDLHSLGHLTHAEATRAAVDYGREGNNRQKDELSLTNELILVRTMLERVLDQLQQPEAGAAEIKAFVPLIYRGVKLVSDLIKQIGSESTEPQWDDVLDRLGDELDIDI